MLPIIILPENRKINQLQTNAVYGTLNIRKECCTMQQKFVPFEKRSKKETRRLNAQKRSGWGGLNPVTRKPQNPKAYNRKKVPKIGKDDFTEPFYFDGLSHFAVHATGIPTYS